MNADLINGGFELISGAMVFLHCWRLYKDKMVKGVSTLAVFFFTLWGFWNLYYYPTLNQWWSFYGGILIVAANTLWVSQIIYYTRKNKWQNTIQHSENASTTV